MVDTKLLEQRMALKKKKPVFVRQDIHKKPKLSEVKWRRPKGLQSKMRLNRKGYRRSVQKGWGSPAAVKGLNRNGLLDVIVNSVSDITSLDPKTTSIVLGSRVGVRTRIQIIEQALKTGFAISNIPDPKKYLEEVQNEVKKRKEESVSKRKERSAKREKDKKEAEKKKAEKEKKEAAKSEEDKAEEKKAEKDAVLTAKQ